MGMERFCLLVDDDDMREDCHVCRRFKDRAHVYGLTAAWDRYRDDALREIAIAWCEAQGIPYTETDG